MRTFLILSLAALPLISPHALEAVAQSPAGTGSGGGAESLAKQGTLTALQAQNAALSQMVVEQQRQMNQFVDCAKQNPPAIWNGSECVSSGAEDESVNSPICGPRQVLTSTKSGLSCVDFLRDPSEYSDSAYAPGVLKQFENYAGGAPAKTSRYIQLGKHKLCVLRGFNIDSASIGSCYVDWRGDGDWSLVANGGHGPSGASIWCFATCFD